MEITLAEEDEDKGAAVAPAPRRSTRVTSSSAEASTNTVDSSKKIRNASGAGVKELEEKMRSANLGTKAEPRLAKAAVKQQKEYLNPLPTPQAHPRPAPLLFVWGTGNAGQFGMGEDNLGELTKPQRNKLVEEMIQEGKFGEKGAGFQAVAAGGMSSLLVDEQGTVSSVLQCEKCNADMLCCLSRYGPAAQTIMPLWDGIPPMSQIRNEKANFST